MWFMNDAVKEQTQTLAQSVDAARIWQILKQNGPGIKMFFSACVHCSYCADTCFMQRNHEDDPSYMPSYKVINSVGKLYRKKGRVSRGELEDMQVLLWEKCALCTRCVCPLQLNIPKMIALGRDVLRSQDVVPRFDNPIPSVDELTRLPEVFK